ncbi:MAG TPA: CHASE2 domain-containing protein [Oscillatoriales cyanobacterium M59_W2019_021]|nr:MAG: CHASE2 domain-containing protein [Cyanobacteria bacterium J055]HIK30667.1 CHASE2 domain-containing protein [Oscillatoriales cyanobacterium M4454_W2019_049]HIK52555.1 CHASE2 domain-containing protein [Oscillatoriales cyanobacterium M59_W2019_021]
MSQLIVLNLGNGNVRQGFPTVVVQWGEIGSPTRGKTIGSLLPATELADLYRQWQQLYTALAQQFFLRRLRQIEIEDDDVTRVSVAEFGELCRHLQQQMNGWLESPSFAKIDRQLRTQFAATDEICVVVEAEDEEVRRLPWHLWQFFEDYPRAEVGLSLPEYRYVASPPKRTAAGVRILAILGNRTGIEVEGDRRLLEALPGAGLALLDEPTRSQLDAALWDEGGWDILFFAGHSQTERETGRIFINPTESLTIGELKNALKRSIDLGLQLAIFNSCDGLGLARSLAQLNLPQLVVMREPVSDRVAQAFLKHLLAAFAGGASLSLAVREARERLQGLESEFPGASWLPVLCQNPAQIPPTWAQLRGMPKQSQIPRKTPRRRSWGAVAIASAVSTTLVMGLRWAGVFQGWELATFDRLVRLQPAEPADKRLLIVGADEEDLRRYGYPLPDAVIARLLAKLQPLQPAAIGLDIIRDRSVEPGTTELNRQIQQTPSLVAVCAFGKGIDTSIAPPPEVDDSRVGFIDLFLDGELNPQDDTVRRYLLSRSANPVDVPSRCPADKSFAWKLAYRYLQQQPIPVTTAGKDWQFGDVVFHRLQPHSGGYQTLDARGNQLLIRYRNTPQIAQQVTIRDILEPSDTPTESLRDRFSPDWTKGRVILIGITATSIQDYHDTPLGKMRGLHVHAQVVSQILSAVDREESRSLFWWLPTWGDALWVLLWAGIGGVVIVASPSNRMRGVGIIGAGVSLVGIGAIVFIQGGWLPLIPALLALGGTAIGMSLYIQK